MKDNNDTLEREEQQGYALKYLTADMIASLNYDKHLKEISVQPIKK